MKKTIDYKKKCSELRRQLRWKEATCDDLREDRNQQSNMRNKALTLADELINELKTLSNKNSTCYTGWLIERVARISERLKNN